MQTEIQMTDGAVELAWLQNSNGETGRVESGTTRLPFLWLRDNCPCDECRVVQTTEKKFILSNVDVDLKPQSVDLTAKQLQIVWPDAHETLYDLDYLLKFKARRKPETVPWKPDYIPRKFDYHAAMDDYKVAREMIEELAIYGAIILNNSPAETESLENLAKRLGPMREMTFDRIHDVVFDPQGYNVAATALKLSPHNDFSSTSWPPSIQVLHMLVNETTGGETVIVDAFAVVERMREVHPAYFDVLCRVAVPFRMFSETGETYAVQPMVRCDTNGRLVHVRFSNQLMQVPDPDTPELDLFYRAYHELCVRMTADSAKVTFRLHGGEMLIVASHRVLHAREAFEPDGERHLRDAYFELENAINHLNVIERTHG